jgi:hypothetical protein
VNLERAEADEDVTQNSLNHQSVISTYFAGDFAHTENDSQHCPDYRRASHESRDQPVRAVMLLGGLMRKIILAVVLSMAVGGTAATVTTFHPTKAQFQAAASAGLDRLQDAIGSPSQHHEELDR